jgi:hypothetical protein
MATITLRNTKGSPLTNAEIDGNFTNLNNGKLETNGSGANVTNLNANNIASGTLAVTRGGTGQTTYTNGQLLIGNTTGNTLTKATLTAGSNIAITNGTGSISIATSLTPSFTTISVSGNSTLTGDIAVNGGDVTTTSTTATLFNANATTLNIGGSATAVNIGAATGTLTVNNTTLAAKAITASTTLNVTGVSTFAAGTALLPSISRTGDTNTGMFFPAADNIGLVTNGLEAIRVNSIGHIGVGNATPDQRLDVSGNATFRGNGTEAFISLRNTFNSGYLAYRQGSLSLEFINVQNGPIIFATNNVQRARMHSSGGVSIGNTTDSGTGSLNVSGQTILGNTLNVTGATTLNSTLGVTGTATVGGALTVTGNLRAPDTLTQVIHKRVDTKVTYAIPGYVAGTTANGVFIAALDTTITPKFSTSKVLVNMCISFEVHNDTIFRLYRVVGGVSTEIGTNSTDANRWSGIWHTGFDGDNNSTPTTNTYFFYDTPNTANAVTYRLMCQSSGVAATTFFLNRTVNSAGSATLGEVAISQVLLQEIC